MVACSSCTGSFSRVLLRQAIGEMWLQKQVVMSRNHLKNQVRLFANSPLSATYPITQLGCLVRSAWLALPSPHYPVFPAASCCSLPKNPSTKPSIEATTGIVAVKDLFRFPRWKARPPRTSNASTASPCRSYHSSSSTAASERSA